MCDAGCRANSYEVLLTATAVDPPEPNAHIRGGAIKFADDGVTPSPPTRRPSSSTAASSPSVTSPPSRRCGSRSTTAASRQNGVGPGQTSYVVLHAIAYPPGGDNTTTVLLGATSGSVAVFRAGDPAHVALCDGDGSSAGGRPSADANAAVCRPATSRRRSSSLASPLAGRWSRCAPSTRWR